MTKEQLKTAMELEGYKYLREIPGHGLCGMRRFIFTVGLIVGLNEFDFEGRYCYEGYNECTAAIMTWDGQGDPPGPWIKYKGKKREYSNPNVKDL
jgi:hypothetical protein